MIACGLHFRPQWLQSVPIPGSLDDQMRGPGLTWNGYGVISEKWLRIINNETTASAYDHILNPTDQFDCERQIFDDRAQSILSIPL